MRSFCQLPNVGFVEGGIAWQMNALNGWSVGHLNLHCSSGLLLLLFLIQE